MPLATKPHGPRRKRNPDDTKEQLDEILDDAIQFKEETNELLRHLDNSVWTYDTCPYMLATEGDDSKCYCSARTREHCRLEIS